MDFLEPTAFSSRVTLGSPVARCRSVYVSNPQKHVRVLAGSTDKLTGGELYEIEKLAVHPNYKPTATETHAKWDIAVVTLKRPLQFSDKVKPIKVAPDTYFEKAFTGGWGKANSVRTLGAMKQERCMCTDQHIGPVYRVTYPHTIFSRYTRARLMFFLLRVHPSWYSYFMYATGPLRLHVAHEDCAH